MRPLSTKGGAPYLKLKITFGRNVLSKLFISIPGGKKDRGGKRTTK